MLQQQEQQQDLGVCSSSRRRNSSSCWAPQPLKRQTGSTAAGRGFHWDTHSSSSSNSYMAAWSQRICDGTAAQGAWHQQQYIAACALVCCLLCLCTGGMRTHVLSLRPALHTVQSSTGCIHTLVQHYCMQQLLLLRRLHSTLVQQYCMHQQLLRWLQNITVAATQRCTLPCMQWTCCVHCQLRCDSTVVG